MSYIAKPYLLKMFSKKSCLKIEGDNIVLHMKNVLNPIKAEEVPDNINDYFIIECDGNILAGKGKPEILDKIKIDYDGQTITKDNYKDLKGKIMDKGEELTIYLPNPGWKVGESHKIKVSILTDNPTIFTITRTVS